MVEPEATPRPATARRGRPTTVCAVCNFPGARVLDSVVESAARADDPTRKVLRLFGTSDCVPPGEIRKQLVECPRCAERDPEHLGVYMCTLFPIVVVTSVRVRRRSLRDGSAWRKLPG